MSTHPRIETARVIETTGVEVVEPAAPKPPIANDAEEAPSPRAEPVIPFASTLRRIA